MAAIVRQTYSLIKIMQATSPNYNRKNGIKQVKVTEENLPEICILRQLYLLPLFALYLLSGCDLFNMSALS